MKWVNVNNGISGDHYELWDNDTRLVNLSLSNRTRTARLDYNSERRLFFIEKKGFLHSKTVVKNEYGIKLGELVNGEEWHEGSITLDGKKYCYAFPNGSEEQVVIYNETKDAPLLRCGLPGILNGISALVEKGRSLHDTRYPSLLMTLCWYMLHASTVEQLHGTAA